ncbi:MurR/RpiR family transcriptional regulator [Pseudoxanthomonas indica]|uniref:Transcriptional regulator, RpiR family n=1 Tax=Pseudoxanthomonas indica TaxID=428993 RepID=A0A1T5KW41_9GAMM|nr:MurR/RpiR family transcriptional regulator [Pseudoxanthomonas indica]GGD52350.1 RpiR family transcriptional regulator [Pseudoxanthomonas indica]SKC68022.1 transcriptional regulator, RpiR family [Pseudoxanthomonas indica]
MYDIVYHLKQRLHELSPVERRIADAILDDVDGAAQSGISELADKAHVSVAAISRFAKTLDCDNVRELRARLAEASAVGKRFLDDHAAPPSSALFAQICADVESCLRRNIGGLQEQVVQSLAEALAGARMIYVFGMGGCSTVFGLELQNRLVRLGRPIAAYSDAISLKVVAATLTPQDVVVALSVSGITPEILSAVDIARGYGARVGAITRVDTPLAERADWLLPIVIDETDFVFKPSASRYAVMLAVDVLATTLALHLADDSRERLRRIKLALDSYRGGENRLPLGD